MNGSGNLESLITHQDSVKRDDYKYPSVSGGVFNFWVYPDILASEGLPVVLPAGRGRQQTLLATARAESMWGSAVAIAIAKGAARGWEVEGNVAAKRERVHDILTYATAGVQVGWTRFVQYHLQAYLGTPFAAVELMRETNAMGSRITGMGHLPPARTELTGDPEIPALYTDKEGYVHELRWWQVGIFSDMPDVDEDLGGAGVCAAERAYPHIRKLAAMERYVTDKVTGRRPLALHFVSGVGQQQLKDSIDTGKTDAERRGALSYMGAIVIPSLSNDVSLVTVPLAELPDGFNRKEEFDIALLAYANALGLDPQDLQPLTGQALGTGAQSQVLDEKSKGKGLNLWHRSFAEWLNAFVTPNSVTFSWYERDLRDDKVKAENMKLRAEYGKILVDMGTITADQYTNLAVDYGDLPDEFLKADATQTEDVADDEKPETVEAAQEDAEGNPIITPQPVVAADGSQPIVEGSTAVDRARQALNGAQVNAALDIVVKIATGELSYDSGINALMLFFNLTEEEAKKIVGNPDDLKPPITPAAPIVAAKAAHADLDPLFEQELARAKGVAGKVKRV